MPRRSNTLTTCAPAALAGRKAMDCALSSVSFRASGVLRSGFGAPARTATPKPTRAMSVVGPGAKRAFAAASANTSRGVTPRSNGAPDVASLIKSGVAPYWTATLYPLALSNCGMSSFSGPAMPPPARALSSAPCELAIGDRTSAAAIVAAMNEELLMVPPNVLRWAGKAWMPGPSPGHNAEGAVRKRYEWRATLQRLVALLHQRCVLRRVRRLGVECRGVRGLDLVGIDIDLLAHGVELVGHLLHAQRHLLVVAEARRVVPHVLRDLHRAELRTAHRAEVRDLVRLLGQGLVVVCPRSVGIEP